MILWFWMLFAFFFAEVLKAFFFLSLYPLNCVKIFVCSNTSCRTQLWLNFVRTRIFLQFHITGLPFLAVPLTTCTSSYYMFYLFISNYKFCQ